ncbi:hypothetical protein PTI98_001704 [Pleurotus ostreatus]|nr:hypothetical protein PTI98_001704 [Pleurotus ostreatus]
MNLTTSDQIKVLLAAPDDEISVKATLELLDGRLKIIDDLRDLEVVLNEAQQHHDTLESKLANSQVNVDSTITGTRALAAAHLHTAQELSLVRHSLADELADITEDLLPHFSDDGERTSTLLEDIQSLHRDLDELSNLKEYVLVIERAVKLSRSLFRPYLNTVPYMTLLSKLQSNAQQPLILLVLRRFTSFHFYGLCATGRGRT